MKFPKKIIWYLVLGSTLSFGNMFDSDTELMRKMTKYGENDNTRDDGGEEIDG